MTNNQQPPIATADLQKAQSQTPAIKPDQKLINFINQPSMKGQIAAALPRHMAPDRMIRIITTEIRKTPALATCDMQSFIGAVVQCSQLGLEPGGALGHAYLLPFGNGKAKSGQSNVQLIIGYRGMIDLARRSGQIVSISARTVRDGDQFHYEYGLDETLKHVPGDNESSPITHVYAVAKLKDGGVQFEVMTFNQIEKVRGQSKAGNNGPWQTHWEEMAKKGLAIDTRIPTPSGWTTMEELQKGHKVFDKDGKVTTVTAVSEIKHLPCFRVTFSNGSSVICDDEHRWLARKGGTNAWRQPYREMTVNEMYEAKEDGLSVTVPVQGALELPEADLPLDPYILGYWLGDGTSRGAQFTCSKEDLPHVMKTIENAGFNVGNIRTDTRSQAVTVGAINGMRQKLIDLKLLSNKHVPDVYMRASIEQRKSLLAGLIDSDGHCEKERGRASFCTTNHRLRDAVFELVCSLGESPCKRDFLAILHENGETKKFPASQIEWTPSFNPFRLARKAANYRGRKISKYLGVKSIEKIESVPTKCIAVDSPSRTYLCGENMAVTHNTVIRRLFKYLPVSIEMQKAVILDEKAEANIDQENASVISAEFSVVEE